MIGRIATSLGDAGININDMAVGASPEGERALMAMGTNKVVPGDVVDSLPRNGRHRVGGIDLTDTTNTAAEQRRYRFV